LGCRTPSKLISKANKGLGVTDRIIGVPENIEGFAKDIPKVLSEYPAFIGVRLSPVAKICELFVLRFYLV
jgi:hypothetical protein